MPNLRFLSARLIVPLSALALASLATSAHAAETPAASGRSPATCAKGDLPEPGVQGEVPAGQKPTWNCGIRQIAALPLTGSVAGTGTCVYVRTRGAGGTPDESRISVIDTSNPARPRVVGETIPVHNGSESLRLVVTGERAVMVSGSTVIDIRDCLKPRVLGEIKWPDTTVPGVSRKNLPHDIRLNRAGTRVYSSFGVWEVDISDLAAPATWKIIDRRCEIAEQVPGPWQEVHRQANKAKRSLCDDATRPAPRGANYAMGGSPLQSSMLWPQFSHSLDFNADDSRMYVGDQAGGTSALWAPEPKVRIVDLKAQPIRVIGEAPGPGHGLDWFRSGGREYVIHSNEGGTSGIMGQPERGDTCRPFPRPTALGWGFEAIITDVTDPAAARNVSMAQIAINQPEHCAARKASGRDPWLAYHLIDNPMQARFAAINFGEAGLRIYDIRDPARPTEVAYFNHGVPVHAGVGHWDAARRLLFVSDSGGFRVLRFDPAVSKRLGL
ncbi:hypothetical protein [Novosphingobium sp.]|uniref:LVIVD repeat-containing protein n=1 Tax=Novosphingobium sp. TaxID=1874826 RepID=UPI00286E3F6D|nr:hypothetical protein [Novosphingobium sp.]